MRRVTYSMNVSLDGYIVDPHGAIDWADPAEEVFRFWTDEIRETGAHLLGRRLYETMLYWETADRDESLDAVSQSSSGPRCGRRSRRWCSPGR